MGDPAVTVTEYGADDLSWLGSAHGFDAADDITIVADDFLSTFPDGRVPSGVALSLLTSGENADRYGKYLGVTNEVQKITRTATGGNVDITFDGETVSALAVIAATTAAQIKAALEGLSNIDVGDVAVTGGAGGPFVVTFGGQYVGVNVPEMVIDDDNATGGTVVVETTTAGDAVVEGRDVFAGLLKKGQKVTAGHMNSAAIVRHGKVIKSKLPTGHGVDSAAEADSVGRIIWLP